MIENIIIALIFMGALAYLAKNIWQSLSSKTPSCAKNCGGACQIDKFEKIEVQ